MHPPKPHSPAYPRAFVLGCDPTAFDNNGNRREFKTVFDIGNDKRYFAGILANLKALDLDLNVVYVQNLVTEFLEKETSKNKKAWKQKASESIAARKAEFDREDHSGQWPVFLTSWLLYEVLINKKPPLKTPKELYEAAEIIPPSQNKLGRPLVPFFRHYKYGNKFQMDYFKKVADLFKS